MSNQSVQNPMRFTASPGTVKIPEELNSVNVQKLVVRPIETGGPEAKKIVVISVITLQSSVQIGPPRHGKITRGGDYGIEHYSRLGRQQVVRSGRSEQVRLQHDRV